VSSTVALSSWISRRHREADELVAHVTVNVGNRPAGGKGRLRIDRQDWMLGNPQRFEAELLDRLRERPRPRRALMENIQQSNLHALPPVMTASRVFASEATSTSNGARLTNSTCGKNRRTYLPRPDALIWRA